MITDLTIYPISGFGELEFYMSPLDVSTLLGNPPDSEKDAENDFFIWHYPKHGLFLSFEKGEDYTLTSLYFEKNSEATFIDTPLFSHTPDSLTSLIESVGHVIFEDEEDPSEDYPTILVSPSLTMTFFFDSSEQLGAMLFDAPPKEIKNQEPSSSPSNPIELNL